MIRFNCQGKMIIPKQGKAKLRVCASCEWIYKNIYEYNEPCPKCQFASYSARYVYGNKCYRFAVTQKPWLDNKVASYTSKLLQEIPES